VNSLSDQELLGAYTRHRSEEAFAELVRRYVDLVHSAARRMVCDQHLAKDVTQEVFLALARQAGGLGERPVLAGWLHRTTLHLAANTVRSDVRRRAREQEATIMHELSESDAVWDRVAPQLDVALGELSEAERDAVLLRYFKRRSAREMASALGISEEAAQKRVNRAVERLRELLVKRGVPVGVGGLAVAMSNHAVQAAPAGLVVSISTSVGSVGAAISTTALETVTQTILMTTTQKVILAVTLAAAVSTGIYQTHRATSLNAQVQALQQDHARLDQALDERRQELDRAVARVNALLNDNDRLRRAALEVPSLRGRVAQLLIDSQEFARLGAGGEHDPTESEMEAWLTRVDRLKAWFERRPDMWIPELDLINERDWLDATRETIESEEDYRRAMGQLRYMAKNQFGRQVIQATDAWKESNPGRVPQDLAELEPYFDPPVSEALLDGWSMHLHGDGEFWVFTATRESPDPGYEDSVGFTIPIPGIAGPATEYDHTRVPTLIVKTLTSALEAFRMQHSGNDPSDMDALMPYLIRAEAERRKPNY
jgi:RNA polymerase sigma factor (sigma-70 family)